MKPKITYVQYEDKDGCIWHTGAVLNKDLDKYYISKQKIRETINICFEKAIRIDAEILIKELGL